MSSFKDLRIVDNFYQTSAFFPMPTVYISTVNDDGSLNIGSYSLCFPYYIAGKGQYAMLLECRNTSNTCHNFLNRGKCAINFIPDDRRYFREAVRLGFPGPSEEKMKTNLFTMENGLAGPKDQDRPQVIAEAFQVFECTWNRELENAGRFRAEDIDDGETAPVRYRYIGIDKTIPSLPQTRFVRGGLEIDEELGLFTVKERSHKLPVSPTGKIPEVAALELDGLVFCSRFGTASG